jgi:hypothetical protein
MTHHRERAGAEAVAPGEAHRGVVRDIGHLIHIPAYLSEVFPLLFWYGEMDCVHQILHTPILPHLS